MASSQEDISGLKVAELRDRLKERGLPTTGRKNELRDRLQESLDEEAKQTASSGHNAATGVQQSAENSGSKQVKCKRRDSDDTANAADASAAVEKPGTKRGADAVEETEAADRTKRSKTEAAKVKAEPEDSAASTADSAGAPTKVKQEPTGDDSTTTTSQGQKSVQQIPAKLPAAPALETVKKEEPDEEPDEDDEEEVVPDKPEARTRSCPYLDTIRRIVLDFDFEKLCSVNMSNQNVYACLVCGKYFQGRGKGTNAYMHSLQAFHHVFINLHTLRFYCLPDNYEVIDPSLEDIKFVLRPHFNQAMIRDLDESDKMSRALDGTRYLPGVVGLNNIKANDYVNVVIQLLNRVAPLREFFLRDENTARVKDPLLLTVAELFRKINNPRAFKAHVSPHEFLQAITNASNRRFKITEQGSPIDLLTWLLNTLHRKLKKHGKTIIEDIFKGRMKAFSRKLPPPQDQQELTGTKVDPNAEEFKETSKETPFMMLAMDLPPPPLFHDEAKQNIIPQVPLFELLNKYDGVTEREYKTYKDTFMKRFQLKELPEYLILHIKRFTKNTFFVEKNPTIVNFPVKNIELRDYLEDLPEDCTDKFSYNLVANIVHDGLPSEGTYRAHVYHKGRNQWYEMQDLHVSPILPEMITLSESYIQIWQRQPNDDTKMDQDDDDEDLKQPATVKDEPQA